MPKATFFNLDPKKRQRFIDAFLKEFTINTFDDASISKVLKSLGMAKGSFYQYFDDKLELFIYLRQYCAEVKMKYVADIRRENFADFWDYWRALYRFGVEFDTGHPEVSNFLYCLTHNVKSPSLVHLRDQWDNEIIQAMLHLLKPEIDNGHFRTDLELLKMAYYLYSISSGLQEHLKLIYKVDIEKNLKNGKPIFMGKDKDALMKTVEDNISLLKRAFEKQ